MVAGCVRGATGHPLLPLLPDGVRPRIAIILPWLLQTHLTRTSLMVNDGPVHTAGHPTVGGGADMTRVLLSLAIGFGLGVGGMSAA